MRGTHVSALLISLVCLGLLAAAAAQSSRATISGIVTDPSGGVIPGVSVIAINLSTGQRAVVTTNVQGFFVLTQMRSASRRRDQYFRSFSAEEDRAIRKQGFSVPS